MNLILAIIALVILTAYVINNDEPIFYERIINTMKVGKVCLYKVERIYQSGRILIYYKMI